MMTEDRGSTKVVHLCRSPVGGLFRHVRDLIGGQARRGIEVGLICDRLTGGAAAEQAIAELASSCALGVARLPMHRSIHWSDIAVIRAAADFVKGSNAEIIHGHGAKGGAYGRLLARRLGIRSVYTPHGGSLHFSARSPTGFVYLGLERVLKKFTDGIIFESAFSAGAYALKIGRTLTPHVVIHNGLHDDEFSGLPPGTREFDFVFVGELRKLKGIDVLLEATQQVARTRDVSVLIVGDGVDAGYYRSRIRALELATVVSISAPVDAATEAFARGRCVVVPSLAESLPYVILEAVAAGVPVIASRVGGIPEIFGAFADSLVPPGDVDALAAAMAAFLDDPAACGKLAARLRTHVASSFRVGDMVDATIRFYDQLLAGE